MPINIWSIKLKHSRDTKIDIKSLAPHKNIPPRVVANTTKRNSLIAHFVHTMYSTYRGAIEANERVPNADTDGGYRFSVDAEPTCSVE